MDVLKNLPVRARGLRAGRIVRDESGLTTVGMVISLTLCLALVFTSAQVYRVNSLSSEIQEVADVAALAAQNEVAEFMIVVRTCDALVLSMTLLGSVSLGAGVVALCVPPASSLGGKLVEFGKTVFEERDRFAQQAVDGLNRLQQALPFLATVRAAEVAEKNGAGGASYRAFAVLVPYEGEAISLGDASAASQELVSEVEERAAELEEASAAAEEAALRAQDAKRRAFDADCGVCPDRCMRERAEKLAALRPSKNPQYYSADVWSFEVALDRAKAYYETRLAKEAPASSSPGEQANSAIRKAFYAYALEELGGAYVDESEDSFDAYFPLLAANTAEMRASSLYTDALWPVSLEGSGPVMHAWGRCPGINGATSLGSVAQMEQGGYARCSVCEFSAASVGGVAAASSSISNGFEYHYRIVAAAAEEYEAAYAEASPHIRQAKGLASGMFDEVLGVFEALGDVRIEAAPPGSAGVVAVAVDSGQLATDGGFESGFAPSGALGTRVAIAGATMIEETAGEGRSVISSLLDGFAPEGGAAAGVPSSMLGCWSVLLETYGEGQDSLLRAVEASLDGIPLVGASGLGKWAAEKLEEVAKAAGLQPVELDALKAVLVNTSYVVERDSSAFSQGLASAKEAAARASSPATDAFSVAIGALSGLVFDGSSDIGGEFEVARVNLPLGTGEVPVTMALPNAVAQRARDALAICGGALGSVGGEALAVRSWR